MTNIGVNIELSLVPCAWKFGFHYLSLLGCVVDIDSRPMLLAILLFKFRDGIYVRLTGCLASSRTSFNTAILGTKRVFSADWQKTIILKDYMHASIDANRRSEIKVLIEQDLK